MKFWDTSAIVPLLVIEPGTGTAKSILTGDSSVVVWWGNKDGNASPLSVDKSAMEACVSKRNARPAECCNSLATPGVRCSRANYFGGTAERLLVVHALRAADAFQLAAALHWCQRQPMNRDLVSFDTRIRDAAYKEGFTNLLP